MTVPRLLVVGDAIADRYVEGRVDRISPEAPVPVLARHGDERLCPGGALNVATNAAALGAAVSVVSVVGDDAVGAALRAALGERSIDVAGLVASDALDTVTKTRFVARGQHVVRVDHEAPEHYRAAREPLLAALERALATGEHDLVLLSDYAKGTIGAAVIARLVAAASDVATVVDPAGRDPARYRGLWGLKANRAEAEALCGRRLGDRPSLEAGARSLRDVGFAAVWITLGAEGCLALGDDAPRHHASRARDVFDVTGAGDTFLAALGVGLAPARDVHAATELANLASGLAVEKRGTSVVEHREVTRRERERGESVDPEPDAPRLLDREAAAKAAARCRERGLRVGFTNGCFDLLHPGHVESLNWIARRVDVLFVGLNTDDSVRRQKGPERPIVPLEDRARMLLALRAVSYVVPFADDTPEALVAAIGPDVLFKGEEWAHFVAGRELVEARGGRVELVPRTSEHSTTDLVERLAALGDRRRVEAAS